MIDTEQNHRTESIAGEAAWVGILRTLSPLVLAVCFAICIYWSWHWPLVHDASIMHYVVFLIDHGMAPYRQIIDINLPGTFMLQWLIVHTFGGGPLGWRLFDILTMLVAVGAACWIAIPYDWRAGAVGGLGLALFHLSNGPVDVGERDWFVMVFMLLGYAFFFHAQRHRKPVFMGLFAAAMGTAASIKPIAALFPFVLLAFACWTLRRQRVALGPYIRWALAGACLPTLATLIFLWKAHAFVAFVTMVRGLLTFYAGLGNQPFDFLVRMLFGRFLWSILLWGLLLSLLARTWKQSELNLLALGAVFGAALYFGQRKGWAQHKATLIAFMLLWVSIQFYQCLKMRGWLRWLGVVGVLMFCAGAGALWMPLVPKASYDETLLFGLQHDLEGLGGPALSGNVQCLEMASGCINDLYRMRLMQPTGFISDFFVFTRERIPALEALKTRFLSEAGAHPPRVIVLVATDWGSNRVTYSQLDNWAGLRGFLAQDYSLYKDKRLPDGSLDRQSYQIYVRKQ